MKRATLNNHRAPAVTTALLGMSLIAATSGLLTVGCSTDTISGTGLRSAGTNTSTQKSTANQRTANKSKSGNLPDGMGTAVDPNAPVTSGGPALLDIIKTCGIDPAKLNDPSAQLLAMNLSSLTAVISGTKQQFIPVSYQIKVQFSQGINVTGSGTSQTTDFAIQSVSTSVGPIGESQTRSEATAQLNANKGTTTSKDFAIQDRLQLLQTNKEWSGTFCTVMPTSEMTVNKGGYSKTIRFTPALPSTVSPLADATRYTEEIGQGRTFTNIKAEVVSSNDPNMPAGRVIMGTVSVAPAGTSFAVPGNANGGSGTTISAEAAYKMSWAFGSAADTVNLGLMPSQTYFINHSQHALAYAVAETGVAEISTLVMHP